VSERLSELNCCLPSALLRSHPPSLLTFRLCVRPLHGVVKHTDLQRALRGVAEGQIEVDGLEGHQVIDTEGVVT